MNWVSIKDEKPLDKLVVEIKLNNGNTILGFRRVNLLKSDWYYYPLHSETPEEFKDWDTITHWRKYINNKYK